MKLAAEKFLDDMKESVEEVFVTMLNTVAVLMGDDPPPESIADDVEHVDVEAVVEFTGDPSGAVILRASAAGAGDIARKLLMMGDEETIDLEEIQDAMGECANMVTGSLKTRALDPIGDFKLSTPTIATKIRVAHEHPGGRLVFALSEGNIAVEIWLSEELG
jgi:CheY-specific phosphatase CheX